VIKAEEQTFIQQLIAHAAVERSHEAILRRLAWRDVMPGDPVICKRRARPTLAS
jgi:hypothetical protein